MCVMYMHIHRDDLAFRQLSCFINQSIPVPRSHSCKHPIVLLLACLLMLGQPLRTEPLNPAPLFMIFSSLSALWCRCIVYEVWDSADEGCCCPARFKGDSSDYWSCIFILCPLSCTALHHWVLTSPPCFHCFNSGIYSSCPGEDE